MLRRIGLKALTVGLLLVGASSALAEPPLYVAESLDSHASAPTGTVRTPGVEQLDPQAPAIMPVEHCTNCEFDPVGHFHESVDRENRRPFRFKLGRGDDRDGDAEYEDFECANCFSRFDVEKRLIFGYTHGNANKFATQGGYGDAHSGQVGAEVLPFVLSDAYNRYTRWGATILFNYSNYEGNRAIRLTSQESGRVLSIDDGETWGFILGPTVRTDFEIGPLRLSPNAMIGVAFEWTTLDSVLPGPSRNRDIDNFKETGFDVGGYLRLMLDFPINDQFTIGVGGDYKFVPTDVMVRDDEFRKHMGLVLTVSHTF